MFPVHFPRGHRKVTFYVPRAFTMGSPFAFAHPLHYTFPRTFSLGFHLCVPVHFFAFLCWFLVGTLLRSFVHFLVDPPSVTQASLCVPPVCSAIRNPMSFPNGFPMCFLLRSQSPWIPSCVCSFVILCVPSCIVPPPSVPSPHVFRVHSFCVFHATMYFSYYFDRL